MALKRQKANKTEMIGVRMPPKLRYGLELVAQKNGDTLSQAMVRALNEYLDKHEITTKSSGEALSLLDKLWSDSESERATKIIGSGFETARDIEVAKAINNLEITIQNYGYKMSKKEFFDHCDKYMHIVDEVADGRIYQSDLYEKAIHEVYDPACAPYDYE